jgi:hypothetical protein
MIFLHSASNVGDNPYNIESRKPASKRKKCMQSVYNVIFNL